MSASSSMASLSRRLLSRSLCHSNPNTMLSMRFCTTTTTTTTHLTSSDSSDSDESITSDLESDPTPDNAQSQPSPEARNRTRDIYDRPLEDGVDVGIYKVHFTLVWAFPFDSILGLGFRVLIVCVDCV